MERRRLTCLLLYNIFSVNEAETVADHVRSFRRYSRHRVVPVWMFGGLPPRIDLDRADVIVIHYSIKPHYDFFMSPETRARIRRFRGLKLVFAQDEYYRVNLMNEVLRDLGVNAVFSVAPEGEMRKIYSVAMLPDVRLVSVLTGYVSEVLPHLKVPLWRERPIDIGYRARKVSGWLGERGQEKWRIAEGVLQDAPAYGLKTDISCLERDRLYRQQWIRFLGNCKAVLGTGSGGSVLDYTGEIQERIVRHESEYPDTPFEILRDQYLKGADGAITFDVISPRCFEAASLRTLMILYEGWYSGVLVPWRHYVPLKKDHSNMEEVVSVLRDELRAQEIIGNAYREVALNSRYSYAEMVKKCDRVVDELFEAGMQTRKVTIPTLWYPILGLRSRLRWHRQRDEKVAGELLKQWIWRWWMVIMGWLDRQRGVRGVELTSRRRISTGEGSGRL